LGLGLTALAHKAVVSGRLFDEDELFGSKGRIEVHITVDK
jgi:hypothetical protein